MKHVSLSFKCLSKILQCTCKGKYVNHWVKWFQGDSWQDLSFNLEHSCWDQRQCIQVTGDFRKAAVGSCSFCGHGGRHTACGKITKMDLQLELLHRSESSGQSVASTSRTHTQGECLGLVRFQLTPGYPKKRLGWDEDSSFMSRICTVLSASDWWYS